MLHFARISQKVLTDSLRALEEAGIVIRTVYPEVPPHVEYSLSELGESTRSVLKAMEDWGLAYQKSFSTYPKFPLTDISAYLILKKRNGFLAK